MEPVVLKLDYVAQVRREVPVAVLGEIVKAMTRAYADTDIQARVICGGHDDQAHELEGRVRRALSETQLRNVAVAFPETVQALSQPSSGCNFFVTLEIGRVHLVAVRVREPIDRPPFAAYRIRMANLSLQTALFDEQPAPADAPLLAFILHGGPSSADGPNLLQIRVPLGDLTGYYDDRIDLRAEFADIVIPGIVEEAQPTAPALTLRPPHSTRTARSDASTA